MSKKPYLNFKMSYEGVQKFFLIFLLESVISNPSKICPSIIYDHSSHITHMICRLIYRKIELIGMTQTHVNLLARVACWPKW